MSKKLIYLLPLVLFMGLTMIFAMPLLQGKDPTYVPETLINGTVPDFDIEGLKHTDIKGPALVNIFASWCGPCKTEHKYLVFMAERKDLNLYGINYKDTLRNRDKFLKTLGNPYLEIGNDPNGLAAIAFGISGVPTSFLIDKSGMIVRRFDGPLTSEDIQGIILPFVREEK